MPVCDEIGYRQLFFPFSEKLRHAGMDFNIVSHFLVFGEKALMCNEDCSRPIDIANIIFVVVEINV